MREREREKEREASDVQRDVRGQYIRNGIHAPQQQTRVCTREPVIATPTRSPPTYIYTRQSKVATNVTRPQARNGISRDHVNEDN